MSPTRSWTCSSVAATEELLRQPRRDRRCRSRSHLRYFGRKSLFDGSDLISCWHWHDHGHGVAAAIRCGGPMPLARRPFRAWARRGSAPTPRITPDRDPSRLVLMTMMGDRHGRRGPGGRWTWTPSVIGRRRRSEFDSGSRRRPLRLVAVTVPPAGPGHCRHQRRAPVHLALAGPAVPGPCRRRGPGLSLSHYRGTGGSDSS